MENTENPIYQRLTEDDLDVLSAIMIIFTHAAERIVGIIELEYEARYRDSKQYKEFKKTLGKIAADEIAKRGVHQMYSGDQVYQIGRILKTCKDLHRMMENLNKLARQSHGENVTEWETFDVIIHDVNLLCYIYGLMGNCIKDDDELKILSTLKTLAKGTRVSPRVMARLKENVEALGA